MFLSKNVLLVGGGGYIGTILAKFLLSNGFHVKCYDNFIYNQASCISELLSNRSFELINADILDKSAGAWRPSSTNNSKLISKWLPAKVDISE